MLLEIGGGTAPRLGYVNLDLHHGEGDMRTDVTDGIPLPDCSVDGIFSAHTLEHIPTHHRIRVFNEMYRVMKRGGTLEIIVPIVGYTDDHGANHLLASHAPYSDPTHVSQFWAPQSFLYFTSPKMARAEYGILFWDFVSCESDPVAAECRVLLRKGD